LQFDPNELIRRFKQNIQIRLVGRTYVSEKNAPRIETEAIAASEEIEVGSSKKTFVEPEISVPVDVLEATTFLQAVDSGVTN
jgi:hypothetical protein